ncbi:ATP-binding protein [Vampirovibrio sp.]|uniref:HAMP domain-containing sensor histidine kinase n=1 Tax=Vampirovibrio sp. TaxID=2717857 RepID=UPI0035935D7D
MAQLSPLALDTITTRFLILFLFLLAIPLCTLIAFTASVLATHLGEASHQQLQLSQNLFEGALAERKDTLELLTRPIRESADQGCPETQHLICLKASQLFKDTHPDAKATYGQRLGNQSFLAPINHQLYLMQKKEATGTNKGGESIYGLPLDAGFLNRIYQNQSGLQTVMWILEEDNSGQKGPALSLLAQNHAGKNLEDATALLALLATLPPEQHPDFTAKPGSESYQISQQPLYSLDHHPIARVVHILPLKPSGMFLDNYYIGVYLIAMASLIFSVLLAMIAARTITQPLLKLITQVNTLSRENVMKEGDQVLISGVQEIRQLAKAFNRMIVRLRQEHKLKDEFVATLTHDLKVPLLAEKQTLAYFIAEAYGTLNTEQKEVLGILKSSNGSCLSLVNGLLEVYRYEAGDVALLFEPVDLVRLMADTVAELRSLAQEKSIQLELKQETEQAETPPVYADSLEIKRILHNLISNAIINTPIHGKIVCKIIDKVHYGSDTVYKVSAFQHTTLKHPVKLKNRLLVVIQDSGIGFSINDLPHLFQQFAASKGRNPMSIGLGLFNCFQVLCAHHNPLWVESTEGEGAAVSFTLSTQQPQGQDRRVAGDKRQRS